MQVEAVFENIAERIQLEIRNAQSSIYIAVAWFTNKNIFQELIHKANNGCNVKLIISNDKINTNIDFTGLLVGESKIYKVGNGDTDLMHNKFCVIDSSTVITGSYNWSYKAKTNFENVIITKGDTVLAQQFISEFNNIKKIYYPDEIQDQDAFPLNKIFIRLEILKGYLLLQDIENIRRENSKLKAYNFNTNINDITVLIEQNNFIFALQEIQKFILLKSKLLIWTDPEISMLNLEIKNLENQLSGYDNEKAEIEKKLLDFQHRHTFELGDIILSILRLRKLMCRDDKNKFNQAESEEKRYKEQFEIEKKKELFKLTVEQKSELKRKFRKATLLCHPDKVSDEFIDSAKTIFIDLKAAYDKNDLEKVNNILVELETGNCFRLKSETFMQKDLLKATILKLHIRIKNLETDIIKIKQSDAFITISDINNWDDYFKKIRIQLLNELEELKSETGYI